MPLDFSLAGKTYEPVEATAEAAAIERYAAAAGDGNPRYRQGPDQVAPPLFSVVAGFPLMMMIGADPALGLDNPLMILHGGQEFRYHRPLRGGEDLILYPSLDAVEDKGANAVFVAGVRAETPDGEPVLDHSWTIFVRGAGSGAERVSSDGGPKAEPVPEDDRFTSEVAPDMPARYAEASGDHNPIHLDEGVARSVGLPGVINHGLGTAALVTGGLVDRVFDGDPTGVESLSIRFIGMVFPGDELVTVIREPDGGAHAFETSRPDGTVVMTGTIEGSV